MRAVLLRLLICTAPVLLFALPSFTTLSASAATLRVAASSTVTETGLIDALAEGFKAANPDVEVLIENAGAMAVLDRARAGHADIVITHHPESEALFIGEGYGTMSTLLMYNEFALFGPRSDPLQLQKETDIRTILRRLAQEQPSFMVPGQRSGTYRKLSELWAMAGVEPDWPGYQVLDSGSATALRTAAAFDAYAFADLGTYLVYRSELTGKIVPLVRDHVALRNYYSATVVNRARVASANQELAQRFLAYLVSYEGQARIRQFGEQRYGAPIFVPAAHTDEGLRARRAAEDLSEQSAWLRRVTILAVVLAVAGTIAISLFMRVRRLERATRRSEQRFALAIAGANDGIWDWDVVRDQIYFSPRLQEILSYHPSDDIVDEPRVIFGERLHPDERLSVMAQIEDYLSGRDGELFETECRWRTEGEEYRWVLIRGRAMRNESGRAVRMSGSIGDITERKKQEQALVHQALHDSLTGLPNRILLQDRIDQAIRSASRGGKCLALLVLDIDHFKEINESLGHQVGDEVLKEIAARLARTLRTSDTVARLGGDEFGLLLPEVAGEVYANHVAKKVSIALHRTLDLEQHALHIGASLGIAVYPQHGEDAQTLIRHADMAMYAAKRNGTGCAVYEPSLDTGSARRLSLANDLHEALERDALSLAFQPIVDLRSQTTVAVETLLRWQHPKQGPIPPDEIVPIAERTGLIKPLTMWILHAALQQQAEWERQGLSLRVSVNLSVWSLQDPKLIDEVREALQQWSVPAAKLELEITEGAMMADPRRSLEILTQLREMGVGLAVDDYGTGFSSLAYLKRLPVDTIKVDKSFVMAMDKDDDDAAIVRSTIELAHILGLRVVAEGVESKAISDKLVALGCDTAQGYYYCRPAPAEACARWLKESPWGGAAFRKASMH